MPRSPVYFLYLAQYMVHFRKLLIHADSGKSPDTENLSQEVEGKATPELGHSSLAINRDY